MRILLINPPINPKKFGRVHILMEPMPCIGLAYIAAVLEREGHYVQIIDNYVQKYSIKRLLKEIQKIAPDIVGIAVLTPAVNFSLELANKIKQYNENIILIAGNVHPTQFPEEFLKPQYFDVVVKGEGEDTIVELVSAVVQKRSLNTVKGISYLEDGKVFHNEMRPVIKNLASLPFPAWHLFPYKKYGLFPFADIKRPVLTVLATRGCPFNCKYCSLGYMDKTYRKRTPENIVDEIEYLIEKYGVKQIGFVDPVFPLQENYAIEVCDELINRGINKKIVWTTETRIDILNENLIKNLKAAGCRRIIFGLESGSEETLRKIGKEVDFAKVKKVMKLLKKYNMESIGLFMIGFPGETEELIKKTFRYARLIDVDFAKFAMTVPFPGSELYEILKKENKIRTNNWDNYTTFNSRPENVSYVPDGMTAKQLISLQKKGTIDFYLRPKMIIRQLFQIRTVKLSMLLKGLYFLMP